jgi:hypothetical protein
MLRRKSGSWRRTALGQFETLHGRSRRARSLRPWRARIGKHSTDLGQLGRDLAQPTRWTRPGTIQLWAFDLLALNGQDWRAQPLVKRQARLQALLERFGPSRLAVRTLRTRPRGSGEQAPRPIRGRRPRPPGGFNGRTTARSRSKPLHILQGLWLERIPRRRLA